MNCFELEEKINDCLLKALIYTVTVSMDNNQICDVLICDDCLSFDGIRSPYSPKDVISVKYYIDPGMDIDNIEEHFVKLSLNNGDYLKMDIYGLCEVRIDGNVLDGRAALAIWRENVYQNEREGFESEKEFFELVEECDGKADLLALSLPQDDDQIADIYFDNGRLVIYQDEETPYFFEDIKDVKWYYGHNFEEPNSVIIKFKNGDSLEFDEFVGISANIFDGNVCHYYKPTGKVLEKYRREVLAQRTGVCNDMYVVVNNTLIRYNGNEKELYLPEGITQIANGVFEGFDIEKVVFPSTLSCTGDYTFRNCKKLSCVILNDRLENIGDRAFCGCEMLKDISLPEGLASIKNGAFIFSGITSIEDIPYGCLVDEHAFDTEN